MIYSLQSECKQSDMDESPDEDESSRPAEHPVRQRSAEPRIYGSRSSRRARIFDILRVMSASMTSGGQGARSLSPHIKTRGARERQEAGFPCGFSK